MKKLLTITALTVLLLAAAAPGRAQTRRKRKAPPPPPPTIAVIAPVKQVPVDQGRFEGGVYSNDFFGLSFATPEGWFTQDAEAKKRIMDTGMEVVGEGATARKKAAMEAAMKRTHFLVSVSKYDPSAPGPDFNALLMCVAERVPSAVITTEAEYIRMSIRSLQGTSAQATMTGPVRTVKLGGTNFATADVKMTIGPMVAVQKYYVRLMKGHALAFVYTYVDDSDLKPLEDLLATVKFK
ncbi:MAG TPA: hypothetical protein VFZ44_19010 [Pyrinomonadaceae bacterium]